MVAAGAVVGVVVGVTDTAGVFVGADGVLLGVPVVLGATVTLGVGVRVGVAFAFPTVGVGSGVSVGTGVDVGASVGVGVGSALVNEAPLNFNTPMITVNNTATAIAISDPCLSSFLFTSNCMEASITK